MIDNTINAMAIDMKITVATMVNINKASDTCGCSIKPSEVGGSVYFNRHS